MHIKFAYNPPLLKIHLIFLNIFLFVHVYSHLIEYQFYILFPHCNNFFLRYNKMSLLLYLILMILCYFSFQLINLYPFLLQLFHKKKLYLEKNFSIYWYKNHVSQVIQEKYNYSDLNLYLPIIQKNILQPMQYLLILVVCNDYYFLLC